MIRVLLYIKHHVPFVWLFIEWLNSLIFHILYGKKLRNYVLSLLSNLSSEYDYRLLEKRDMVYLYDFFLKQPAEAFRFFKPHGFDLLSLQKKNRDKSFIMIGTFRDEDLVGYCFLRCFFNKQAFRGKIVDYRYQGRGIAKQMGFLTTSICQKLGFRLFATISKDNIKSIASSKAVNTVQIIKELPDNYVYVEYLSKK